MPVVNFVKPNLKSIDVNSESSLMDQLLANQLPVASSCGGQGVCGKCAIRIVKGQENLSPESEYDTFLKAKNNIPSDCRISCQVKVLGNVTIDTNYW